MTKIPLKPKNYQKYPLNLKNDRNTSKTYMMIKIHPKPKKGQNGLLPFSGKLISLFPFFPN